MAQWGRRFGKDCRKSFVTKDWKRLESHLNHLFQRDWNIMEPDSCILVCRLWQSVWLFCLPVRILGSCHGWGGWNHWNLYLVSFGICCQFDSYYVLTYVQTDERNCPEPLAANWPGRWRRSDEARPIDAWSTSSVWKTVYVLFTRHLQFQWRSPQLEQCSLSLWILLYICEASKERVGYVTFQKIWSDHILWHPSKVRQLVS